jgi:hypothetical protein
MSSLVQYFKDAKWGPLTVIIVAAVIAFIAGGTVAVIIGGATLVRFLAIAHQAWGFIVATGLLSVAHAQLKAASINDPSLKGDPSDTKGASDVVDDDSATVPVRPASESASA